MPNVKLTYRTKRKIDSISFERARYWTAICLINKSWRSISYWKVQLSWKENAVYLVGLERNGPCRTNSAVYLNKSFIWVKDYTQKRTKYERLLRKYFDENCYPMTFYFLKCSFFENAAVHFCGLNWILLKY